MAWKTLIDLTGQRFGRLVVVERAENRIERNGNMVVQWLCKCDCGNYTVVRRADLTNGRTRSCGCLLQERRAEILQKANRSRKNGIHHGMFKHGLCGTRLYRIWQGMKRRCYNSKVPDYKYYGGRGIKVCEEWKDDFQKFADWAITHGYTDNLTIDRRNVNGDYEPSNCQWVTMAEQANNRRTSKKK